ncbi:carbonic anhydrase 2-like isoform X2 [Thrips palmi]|uniref:Carbonic anhydrase n=1 Tax=Thrips palmi TaxID=161013 RepID=A0A6P8YU06_THRPL|nr:carbonic anhydrase 2-like isoform X2 [Thrips palmi]
MLYSEDSPYYAAWCCAPVSSWRYPETEANGWTGACRNGTEQSPIDIPTGDKAATKASNFEPLVLVNYDNLVNYNMTNNGETVVLTADGGCNAYVTGGGLRKLFKLEQMHFHWGSEHLVGGLRYPLELHLVHYDANYGSLQEALGKNGSLAVIAVLFRYEKNDVPNSELGHVVAGLKLVKEAGRQAKLGARLSPGKLLPTDTERWWRYAGSLTTPGCDQGVVWTVFRDTLPAARNQLKEFQTLQQDHGAGEPEYILKNFRAPQPIKHRTVFYQDPANNAKCGASASGPLSGPAAGAVLGLVLAAALANVFQKH